MKPAATWAAILSGAVVYDVACDRRSPDSTLSHVTRATFRTDTKPGRAAFRVLWFGFAVWYYDHILKRP